MRTAPARINEKTGVKVNWVRLHRNKLKKGHLLGNRFTITVTQAAVEGEEAMTRAEAVAALLRRCGLPNYYGPQRLGQNGANVRRGWELLQGQKRMSNRWLRSLLLASVQSHLCNRYLTLRQQRGQFATLLTGDIAKKHDTGGLFVVADQPKEQSRYEQKEISFTAPIYGPKMWDAEAESGELEQEGLGHERPHNRLVGQGEDDGHAAAGTDTAGRSDPLRRTRRALWCDFRCRKGHLPRRFCARL